MQHLKRQICVRVSNVVKLNKEMKDEIAAEMFLSSDGEGSSDGSDGGIL